MMTAGSSNTTSCSPRSRGPKLYDDCPLKPVPRGIPGECDRCGKKLVGRQTRWCSDRTWGGGSKCARLFHEVFERNHDWNDARKAALKRDRNRCVKCGSTDRLEVNHIVPREGRGYGRGCWHHLDGLETLCHDCHVETTRQQAQERRTRVTIIGLDPSLTSFGISDGVRHETIKTTPDRSLRERVDEIQFRLYQFVHSVYLPKRTAFVIEAPMLSPDGAGHLYEVGQIMRAIDQVAYAMLGDVDVMTVPNGTLLKWATGKGNTPKAELAKVIFKLWGTDIPEDRGLDKLFAYMLHRYGKAVVAGEHVHVPAQKRGKGQRATETRRRAVRARALG
jgi:5-methylcytosine-specific restriction endonuclease McrA